MQKIHQTDNGKWYFVCSSRDHLPTLPRELYSDKYDSKEQVEHMLETHNKRRHGK